MNYQHDSAGSRSGYAGDQQSRFGFRQGSQKYKKGMLGLQNLGNTCFMNSALQCMTHTHGLQKYFRFCSHSYTSKGQSSRQKLLMAFAHWFERDWGKTVSANYHSPEDIFRSVQQLNPVFQGYSQQDAQEFLRCVLDNMHEELRREVPDDLNRHLRISFGIESQAELTNSQPGQSSSQPRIQNKASSQASGKSKTSPTSSARQFMQLCQSTEGVTDVGEIRLPEAPPPSSSQSSAAVDFLSGISGSSGKGASASEADDMQVSDADSTTASSSSAKASKEQQKKEEEEEKTHFTSIVSELFQARIVSCVQCMDCGQTSKTHEVIYDVSVPIPNANEIANGPGGSSGDSMNPHAPGGRGGWGMFGGLPGKVKGWFLDKGVDITDCLRKYCAPEYLTGKDKVFCERCKRKNDAEKRIFFKDAPEVLCVHIKRFRYDAGWFNGTKNSKVVTFPVTRVLDLSSFLDEVPAHPVEYKLVGLIQHIGNMGGGHYISYCQHKRKPQEWYEFDDTQVSLVSPEQVERAEPYVLFYQRLPSKGCKLDRQTFKNDMRLVQSQIRTYLMNRSAGDAGNPSNPGGSESAAQMAVQNVNEELRHHGPALRNLYKKPPPELEIVFVSKHWYVRLTTMSDPGPLDNYLYLCPHQLLGSQSSELAAEPFIPISRNLWQSLVRKYGGGPEIKSLELCTRCQTYLRAYNERKQAELDLVTKYDTKDTGDGSHWYLVDNQWVNKWKRYVRADQATDISDVSPPGPVTNDRLFDKENPDRVRDKLKLRLDYIGVNARVWWLFMHVHGGGPSICRSELDIYSMQCNPEIELKLEELKGSAAAEFARRISREFVDDCRGDLDVYNRKYSTADENSMQVDEPGSKDGRADGDLDERVRRLSAELEELLSEREHRRSIQKRQVTTAEEDLRSCRAKEKALRDAGATGNTWKVPKESNSWQDEPRGADIEEQLAYEVSKAKNLQSRLDRLQEECLAAQRSSDASISAKEEELRRCKLELQKAQQQR